MKNVDPRRPHAPSQKLIPTDDTSSTIKPRLINDYNEVEVISEPTSAEFRGR